MPEFLAGTFQIFALYIVEIDPEHTDLLVLELVGQVVEFRNLGAARAAPFRPIVEYQPLTVQTIGGDFLSVLVNAVVITATPPASTPR